jgi:hypothetical protein
MDTTNEVEWHILTLKQRNKMSGFFTVGRRNKTALDCNEAHGVASENLVLQTTSLFRGNPVS